MIGPKELRLQMICIIALAVLVLTSVFATAQQDDEGRNKDESPTEKAWKQLALKEPDCTEAILYFAKRPEEAVSFFTEHLSALRLDEETFEKLLSDLGSEDETVAKAAHEKLLIQDPRLYMGLEEVMEKVKDTPAQTRMVEVLMTRAFDSMKGEEIRLRRTNAVSEEASFNFVSGGTSFWAEAKVERLGTYVQKPGWARAIRAIKILEDEGSPQALAILARMAQGHPEAQPTRIAKKIAMRIKLEKAKEKK